MYFAAKPDDGSDGAVSGSISVQFAFIAAGLYCKMDVSSSRGGGMKRIIFLTLLLTGVFGWFGGGAAFAAEKRIALVIGEASYKEHPLATAANDAGLIAQTLQAAGFDVTGARDLDEDGLRRALRDFLDKAGASGPETVAFVYFAGLGLQLDGENYLIPVD